MKIKIALLFILLTLCLPLAPIAAAPAGDRNGDELIKKQKDYFEAIKNKDDKVAGVIADDYVGVYADGIIDRAHELKDLKSFALVLSDYQMSQEKVAFPNPKTGIVTFHLHVKVTVNGKDFYEDDNVSCVWTHQKKGWQISSQSAVKVAGK